jgi:hypothetical protein
MIEKAPPRWLEGMLLKFLAARDRETISGDLLEEYREEQVPRFGSLRANVWYLCQTLSLISVWDLLGPALKGPLMGISVFTAAAGVWLAVMENILQHAGYAGRTLIAVCMALQGVATLLLPMLDGRSIFRALLAAGAVALGLFGAAAVERIMEAPHFEGFVLLIGCALVAQAVLTVVVVFRPRHGKML